ncbi:MAG: hypothetical protein M3468_00700 [Acidobacteriota bacterium]|nr:hypothetical protein [Acidobacteriota bacterium]
MQPNGRRSPLRVALIVTSVAVIGSLLPPSSATAQQPTDTSRGLSMLFADGRRLTRPLTASGQMATTGFPTLPGRGTFRDGASLTGYRVAHVLEGADALIAVSIQFGAPRKELVKVATIRLSGDAPVTMNQLRDYGVEPITFSIVPIVSTGAPLPVGVSVSPQPAVPLDVRDAAPVIARRDQWLSGDG